MDKNDYIKRIMEEEDYIKSPKFNNSLAKFLSEFPEGADNNTIARLLLLTEEEVETIYNEAVSELRSNLEE